MSIEAKIIRDSVSPEGIRLTTMQLKYPRIIHAEFMTHRVFGRNASSSRAIPIQVQIQHIINDPAEPMAWGSNKPGMQAGAELTGFSHWLTRRMWHFAKRCAIFAARMSLRAGAHKQIANRLLEPWSHISVVVTSTDWSNFYALRDHEDADPTIRALAVAMKSAHDRSIPDRLIPGMWHLPYVRATEEGDVETRKKMSAARCARVSYMTHDRKAPSLEQDLKLFDQLVGNAPVHASPLEHQATPDKRWSRDRWSHREQHGNLRGWRQHRKMITGEAVNE